MKPYETIEIMIDTSVQLVRSPWPHGPRREAARPCHAAGACGVRHAPPEDGGKSQAGSPRARGSTG